MLKLFGVNEIKLFKVILVVMVVMLCVVLSVVV